MAYEHLSRCLILEDPSLRFLKLFQVVATTIIHGDILRSMALVLGVNKLLATIKDTSGLHLIIIGKVFS